MKQDAGGQSVWSSYHRRWQQLKPPLRPNDEVVAAIRQSIANAAPPTMLLGVTPELAEVSREVVAVDYSPGMIANLWPGDTALRRAVLDDWRTLSFPDGSFGAAVGDGSLNALAYPADQTKLFARLAHILNPEAAIAIRLFVRPDENDTLRSLHSDATARAIGNFHAFKWRLAMIVAAQGADPNVGAQSILDTFDREFPDRDALAASTGWRRDEIDTIDVYRGSSTRYCFPTRTQFLAAIPDSFVGIRFLAVGRYPLAERCPVLTMVRRA